jgi:hypothetical protein
LHGTWALQNNPPTARFVIKALIFCVRHKERRLAHNAAEEKTKRVVSDDFPWT